MISRLRVARLDPSGYRPIAEGWAVSAEHRDGIYAPEPATLAVLALGGFALLRRRRAQRQ